MPDDMDDRMVNVIYRIDPSGRVEAVHRAGRHGHTAGDFWLAEDGEVTLEPPGNWPPVFNRRGQVVFYARISSDGGEREGIFLAQPGSLFQAGGRHPGWGPRGAVGR